MNNITRYLEIFLLVERVPYLQAIRLFHGSESFRQKQFISLTRTIVALKKSIFHNNLRNCHLANWTNDT